MPPLTVVYDACVLYPAPMRDLLMQLAVEDVFKARWTDDIHDEWIRNLLENRPDLLPSQLERTRRLMDTHVENSLVTGYEPLIETLTLPDPDDRHVLAAAIHTHADRIITFNLKDFPAPSLAPYDIEAQHPDQFVLDLLTAAPEWLCSVLKRQRTVLKHPPVTTEQFLDTLMQQRLVQTVEALQQYKHSL